MPQQIYIPRSTILKHFALRNTLLHLPNGVVYDLSTFESGNFSFETPSYNFAIDGYFLLLLEIQHGNLRLFNQLLSNNISANVDDSMDFYWHFLGYLHGFTLPDYKIETTNWIGNNEIEYHYPYKVSYEKNLTVTIYDTESLFFQSFILSWLNVCVPNRNTNFYLKEESRKNNVFMPIKANICICITDAKLQPHFAMLFTGVFPTNCNLDALSMSIDDIKIRTININFSFDRLFIHPKILDNLFSKIEFLYQEDTFEAPQKINFVDESKKKQSQNYIIPNNSSSNSNSNPRKVSQYELNQRNAENRNMFQDAISSKENKSGLITNFK